MKLPLINIKRKLLTGFVLSIVLSVVGLASAQELVRTITITPPTASFTVDPGGKTEGQMKIINDSPSPITFSVNVQDYIVVDNSGTPNILPSNTLNNKYSAASWIAVNPTTFTVEPGQKQLINYFVQVPNDASPCGHYAAAVFTPQSKGGGGSGAVVTGEVGTLFYITVNGKCKEQATVTKFFTNAFLEYGPAKILTQIKNFGDLHITPKGTVTVSGLFFNKSDALPTHNIFPQTARDYENVIGQTLMIGRYKAELVASYGINNNLPLTASVYFWVFPWRLVIVIILIIVAVILGYKYYQKRKKDASKGSGGLKNEAEKDSANNEVTPQPPTKQKVG